MKNPLRPRPLPQNRLRVNGVPVDWEPIRGLTSIGASLGSKGSKVLVAGSRATADLVLAGSLVAGSYPFYWDTSSPELASFACKLMGFDSCAFCSSSSVDVMVSGRAPAPSFFSSLKEADLSALDWREVSQVSGISVDFKPYLDVFRGVFKGLTFRGIEKSLLVEGNNDQTRLIAEAFEELGGRMPVVRTASGFMGDLVYRDNYVWPSHEEDLWSRAVLVALQVGGKLAVGLDAPSALEEVMERNGGKLVRFGVTEYDLSSSECAFDLGVSSRGYWVRPKLHMWKDAAVASVAYAIPLEHPVPLPPFSLTEVAGTPNIAALGWVTYEGWGWKAAVGDVGGYRVAVVQEGERATVRAEGEDATQAREIGEKIAKIVGDRSP
ncbi:hypothetical protein PQ610_05170 [Tardisphaera miroshnichenkoae]